MGVSSGNGVSGAGLARGFGVSGAGLVGGSSVLQQILGFAGLQALYDPSDLTSIYQSRTGGSTGAVDSVVGIMLDKSEMGGKTAAAFIAGQSGLTLPAVTDASSAPGTATYVGGALTLDAPAGGTARGRFQLTTVANTWYRLTCSRSGGTNDCTLDIGTTAGGSGILSGVAITASSTVLFMATGTTTWLNFYRGATASSIVTALSVKALPGYHALAPSDAARPILRAGYVDCDGTDDWMQIFPTLDLGATWWHVGGWTMETTNRNAFCLSAAAASSAYRRDGTAASWLTSDGVTYAAPHSGNPTATHVVTLEHSGYAGTLAGRYNGANAGSLTPKDYSAESKALALFTRTNASYSNGLDGRFYGGAFGTGTLSSADRALLERYVASLTGVLL